MRRCILGWIAGVMMMVAMSQDSVRGADKQPWVFISSFAAGENGAITAFALDVEQGTLTEVARTTGVANPFFLAITPNQKYLYSIHAESFGGKNPEQVAAYELDRDTGKLRLLNRQSTRGTASCYLEVDREGQTLLVANYATGNVASLPIRQDGSLGESASFFQHAGSSVNPARQKGPYAHSIVRSPDNRFALVADLGLDQILVYQLDGKTAKLVPHQPPFAKTPAGAGPRHLTFHPQSQRVYVINELLNSVTLFDYDVAAGKLVERQTISTLPADFTGTSHCADLKITPNGKFLYGTNRGHDSIAMYSIGDEGRLSLLGIVPSRGKGPQNLLIAGDGSLLLCGNMPGNNVSLFRIDPATGKLRPVGEPLPLTSPSCLRLASR